MASTVRTMAPAMPPKIASVIHEEWDELDPEASRMLQWMKKKRVFHEFAHGRAPFISHLRGTWAMLECWDQPQEVCRCGLLHSAYTRAGFYFRYFDLMDPESRQQLTDLVGKGAEDQIYKYCAPINLWDTHDKGDGSTHKRRPVNGQIRLGEPLPKEGTDLPMRFDPSQLCHLSPRDMANYLVVMVADIAEQMTPVISYRDVYHEASPERLWPGAGEPVAGYFSMFSRMLSSARPHLEVVPPVFNHCTEILSLKDEIEARDAYWKAVQQEKESPKEEQATLYRRAIELNPHIAEPHAMLSQILCNSGEYQQAIHHAAQALHFFYMWGTHWDKRISYAQWIGFARIMVVRAQRLLTSGGKNLLPSRPLSVDSAPTDTEVTFLQDLMDSFKSTTASQVDDSVLAAKSRRARL